MKILLALFLGAFLLLGCTGSGGAQASAQVSTTEQPTVTATATATVTATATATTGASALVMCTSEPRAWKINYAVAATVNGEASNTNMIQYMKGKEKIRTDVSVSGIESRTYILNNKFTSCINFNGAWTCTEGQYSGTDVEGDVSANAGNYQADGTMEVAGTTANCFKGSIDGNEIRYCVSNDCVPLYVAYDAVSNGNTVKTETTATSYTTIVADSDFVLPG